MSRANRKREPEQWPRFVNLGLGVVLAGVVAYQLFAPAIHTPRTPDGKKLASGEPGSPLSALFPGAGGPTVPDGRRDPFTPLPPGSTPPPSQATPGTTAPGMAGLPEPNLGVEAGRGSRSGSGDIWIPPSLRSLPPVTPGSGAAPALDIPPTSPVEISNPTDTGTGQDSGGEMVMVPTRLLEARGGKNRTARFQYGGEMLTRRQGDYLGTYRVERVDHDAIILIDSKKRRVRLLTGDSVNGTPTASAPTPPIQAVVPRTPRATASTPPSASVTPVASAPPAPRPTPSNAGARPIPVGGPLPTVKGSGNDTDTPPATRTETPAPNPVSVAPTTPTAPRPAPTEAARPVRNSTPPPPAEGPLPLTRK